MDPRTPWLGTGAKAALFLTATLRVWEVDAAHSLAVLLICYKVLKYLFYRCLAKDHSAAISVVVPWGSVCIGETPNGTPGFCSQTPL